MAIDEEPDPDAPQSPRSSPTPPEVIPPLLERIRENPRQRNPPGEWWKVHREPVPPINLPESSDESSEDELDVISNDGQFAGGASDSDPLTFASAMKQPDATKWCDAATEEINNHM